ncbi:MAG: hypothetical protein K6G54_00660 [Oscillospiraceae bacterium]|nr:hypothetical protein [Oscillospiraceae bacterium]
MANFEDLKRAAQNAAYTAAEKAQDVAAAAGEKAGAVKDVAKTNLSLVTEKRSLEKSYQALGEWYAAQCGDDVPEAAADLVATIRATQEKLEELKALKGEQDASTREMLGRGKEFLSEKAEALVALARKPLEARGAQKAEDETAEAPAELPEEPAAACECAEQPEEPAEACECTEPAGEAAEAAPEAAEECTACCEEKKPDETAENE